MVKTYTAIGSRILLFAALASFAVVQAGTVLAAPATCDMISAECIGQDIKLLAPLNDETYTLEPSSTPLETFFKYFNMSWPWLLGVASGISVLQAMWGGILIMTSFDRDGGKEKIEWALGGMVMIALAGFILRFLNSMFYA